MVGGNCLDYLRQPYYNKFYLKNQGENDKIEMIPGRLMVGRENLDLVVLVRIQAREKQKITTRVVIFCFWLVMRTKDDRRPNYITI